MGLYDLDGCKPSSQLCTGVVTRISQSAVTVACEDSPDGLNLDTDALYNLMKLANDVTYKRMKKLVREPMPELNRYPCLNTNLTLTLILTYSITCCPQGLEHSEWVQQWTSLGFDQRSLWLFRTWLDITTK